MRTGDRLRGRGEDMGRVVNTGSNGEKAEGHAKRDLGSGMGEAAEGIWQARWVQGRAGGGVTDSYR